MSVFEIREYLDEAGNVAGPGEVVDLQRELEQFQGVLDSKQEAAAAAPAGDEKAEAARKALHELTQKMRSLGAANLGADDAAGAAGGGGGGGFDDPDAAFIRELHTLQEAQAAAAAQAAHQPEDASDIFERLAALEAQAATSKDKERSGISSSGWGKGFFGNDKAAAAAATAAKPKPAQAAPAPAPAPAPAGPVAFSGGIVEKGF